MTNQIRASRFRAVILLPAQETRRVDEGMTPDGACVEGVVWGRDYSNTTFVGCGLRWLAHRLLSLDTSPASTDATGGTV